MFSIATKTDFWGWLGAGVTPALEQRYALKGVQDCFILSQIGDARGIRLLEVGGGPSRILKTLAPRNECWNAEKLDHGTGRLIDSIKPIEGVKTVEVYLGEFSPQIPSDYFDFVVSISVVEHVPGARLNAFFRDCMRVLRPGGTMLHAVDLYLFDRDDVHPRTENVQRRIDLYRNALAKLPATFLDAPDEGQFHSSARWASHPDMGLYAWNKHLPEKAEVRARAQVVCLKVGMRREI